MKSFVLVKSNGKKEKFNPHKIESIVKRLGGNEALAKKAIAQLIETFKGQTVPSLHVSQELKKILKSEKPVLAQKYNLRHAILKLGPTGFDFEKYVAAILNRYGYKAEVPAKDMQGACITHEVDVIATKDGRTAVIEAKFRHNPNDHINIKDTMSTWARYMDLLDGARVDLCPHFDEVWIMTNARFSKQSLQYGHCKNMVLIGWNHPHERTFAKMIDILHMYPITIFDEVSPSIMKMFSKHNIMLCSDLADKPIQDWYGQLDMPKKLLENIHGQCQDLMEEASRKKFS